ncbi:hypothetical protein KVF89_06260 [Nocardioides carbamazepini]|uniref:hypothetical protein n=1 Tax=Nocardioides carbamazepini TaxID=2854259 RepID=UPI0021499BCA|nr:hypothetical protein [Nocardioides carbamazepini]MCR1782129.1 hypothetical protein [Nocardioides carbamazepini]
MSLSSRLSRETGAGVVLAVVLAGLLSACSDGTGPTSTPVAGPTADLTAAAAADPPPRPSDETELLARPETRVIQRWAAAFAEVVNAEEDDFAAAAPTMTSAGLERMAIYTRRDRGRYFPGPLPVTVVGIPEPNDEDVTMVRACVWIGGWSQESRTDPRREPREVIPVVIGVVEQDGTWLVDGMGNRKKGSCAGIDVPGRSEG